MKHTLWRLAAVALFGLNSLAAWSAVRYVDINVVGGTGDGSSWPNASTNLRAIVDGSASNDQIWVAQGTYTPTNGTDRSATFRMRNFTALYGGFTNGMASVGERNWTNYETILSGNIGNLATNNDNCSNVVIAASNTVVDGFIITAGFCTNTGIANGAGMYVDANAPFSGKNVTIANCTFASNIVRSSVGANGLGAGLYMKSQNSNTVVRNCRFFANEGTSAGAGIYSYGNVRSPVLDCAFYDNLIANPVGQGAGGAGMVVQYGQAVVVSNCVFTRNSLIDATGGATGGGGLLIMGSYAYIYDCVIVSNRVNAGDVGGGGVSFRDYLNGGTPVFSVMNNCIISGNSALTRGGGLRCETAVLAMSNCVVAGNYAGQYGAGILIWRAYTGAGATTCLVANCSILGNVAGSFGGGIFCQDINTYGNFKNCTIAGNSGPNVGGIYVGNCTQFWSTNCIYWGNSPFDMSINNSTSTVSYCDIAGGLAGITNSKTLLIDGGGNINADPLFASSVTGRWTAAGVYDPAAFQCTLTAGGAAWTPGEHAGKTVIVNTNTANYYQYPIVTNTATTLTIWGTGRGAATNTAFYRIVDVHEQSKNGRYTPIGWVTDSNHSPCIDAGDPNSGWANEPRPNGGRINMGRYGNTLEASMAYVPYGTVVFIR